MSFKTCMNLFTVIKTKGELYSTCSSSSFTYVDLKVNGDQTFHVRFLVNNGLGPYTKLL